MPIFSGPEADFCIAVLASELRAEPGSLRVPENINWKIVAAFLQQNHLSPHFYALGQKKPGLFPPVLRSKLREVRYATLLYGDQCLAEVLNVLTALKQTEIPVIVMKGWAVIYTIYGGDYGQRSYSDLDILIPPDRIDQVDTLLKIIGYAEIAEVHPGYTRQLKNCQVYVHPKAARGSFGQFAIGLHWGLTHYLYYDEKHINIPELFERARPLQIAGVDVFEMGFEDQLTYSCAYLALHHRNEETLLTYFEIASLIQRADEQISWTVLTARAKKWRYLVHVQVVLGQVDRLWPGVIHQREYESLMNYQAPWQDRLIDRLVANTKSNGFQSSLLELLAMPGIANKFSSAFHQLFPDKEFYNTAVTMHSTALRLSTSGKKLNIAG